MPNESQNKTKQFDITVDDIVFCRYCKYSHTHKSFEDTEPKRFCSAGRLLYFTPFNDRYDQLVNDYDFCKWGKRE